MLRNPGYIYGRTEPKRTGHSGTRRGADDTREGADHAQGGAADSTRGADQAPGGVHTTQEEGPLSYGCLVDFHRIAGCDTL